MATNSGNNLVSTDVNRPTGTGPGALMRPGASARQGIAPRPRTRIGGLGRSQGEIMFQPWITLFGASDAQNVLQAAAGWLDGAATKYTLLVGLLEVVNCELHIQTSIDVAGPWRLLDAAYTTSTVTTLTLTSEDSDTTKTFDRYLRWMVKPTDPSWSICFQLKALPSESVPVGGSAHRRA